MSTTCNRLVEATVVTIRQHKRCPTESTEETTPSLRRLRVGDFQRTSSIEAATARVSFQVSLRKTFIGAGVCNPFETFDALSSLLICRISKFKFRPSIKRFTAWFSSSCRWFSVNFIVDFVHSFLGFVRLLLWLIALVALCSYWPRWSFARRFTMVHHDSRWLKRSNRFKLFDSNRKFFQSSAD